MLKHYDEGREYVYRNHRFEEVENLLVNTTAREKLDFLEGLIAERRNGQGDDLYRVIALILKDILESKEPVS